MKVHARGSALSTVKEEVDDPERGCVGVADAAGSTVVKRVAFGDPVRDADALGGGLQNRKICDQGRIRSDESRLSRTGELAVAAIVVLGEQGDVACGQGLRERNSPVRFVDCV